MAEHKFSGVIQYADPDNEDSMIEIEVPTFFAKSMEEAVKMVEADCRDLPTDEFVIEIFYDLENLL